MLVNAAGGLVNAFLDGHVNAVVDGVVNAFLDGHINAAVDGLVNALGDRHVNAAVDGIGQRLKHDDTTGLERDHSARLPSREIQGLGTVPSRVSQGARDSPFA